MIRFFDQVYIIDKYVQDSVSGIIILKDGNKIDDRSVFQKRIDRERFKTNKINTYSNVLNKMLKDKLQRYHNQPDDDITVLSKMLWNVFGISRFPDDKNTVDRIKTFFELYNLIQNIKPCIPENRKSNKAILLKSLDVLKTLENLGKNS